jgi:hypothetical protein
MLNIFETQNGQKGRVVLTNPPMRSYGVQSAPNTSAASEESAETVEAPKKLKFEQLKYGKKVKKPGGPIVRGYEHTVTGASKGFPFRRGEYNDVFPHVHSTTLDYPWKNEDGQILVKEMEKDGQKYMVCQRYKIRSEGGDSGRGRGYHEMQYIVIPKEEWSIAAIPKLVEVLNTTPILKDDDKNWEMPLVEIEVPAANTKLPEGWFDDYVQDLVAHIVSGKPIQLQDWHITEKEFLQKLYYALLCIPLPIANKISFGTGLYEKGSEYNADIAHCIYAYGGADMGAKKIAEKWKDFPGADDEFGGKYIEYLKAAGVDKAAQLKDVLQAIPNLPIRQSVYEHFGMDPDTSGEEELVKEWLEVKGTQSKTQTETSSSPEA